MKVIFFGSSIYVVPVLEALYKKHHDIVLALTTELGQRQPVKFFCQTKNIKCQTVKTAHDLKTNYEIQAVGADVGVVADFGIIIPKQVLDFFPKGVLNVHPSLLPKYRGASPVQSAILNGETTTGVSIIKLDNLMDHGPILAQEEMAIEPADTAKDLYNKLFDEGAKLLSQVLSKLSTVSPVAQNHEQATFTRTLTREDGFFDHTQASDLIKFNNMVRAYYPWPGVWTKIILDTNNEHKIVKFLPNQLIQVEGKTPMNYKDFINGYPNAEPAFIEFIKKGLA